MFQQLRSGQLRVPSPGDDVFLSNGELVRTPSSSRVISSTSGKIWPHEVRLFERKL